MVMIGVLFAPSAHAVIGTLDTVPAATLLVPYFEVDTVNANGINTLFSVQNASATAVLAHVTIWTDLSAPVTNFNIYLTGYDMQTIDLGNLIRNGVLPQTASAGQDPGDLVSPKGPLSQDINFASCSGQLPPAPFLPSFVTQVKSLLTGGPDSVNQCGGRALGDGIARGYLTIDTVNNCTQRFPGDVGYFGAGGTGDATNQNVLMGDFFYVNPTLNLVQGATAVHIEASATNPETSVAGQYTFYGRYVNFLASDNREPLAGTWTTQYTDAKTDLIVWRDAKVNQNRFACPAIPGARPSWYPLGREQVALFDMQEEPAVYPAPAPGDPTPPVNLIPFPAAAGRVKVGIGASFGLQALAKEGLLYLNLNTTVAPAGANPPEDPAASQSYVLSIRFPEATNGPDVLSTAVTASALDSSTQTSHIFLPLP
ncbi:MAG: hypothetical protein ABIT01_11820 [Thermoanaerobaculia bacterium]